MAKQSLQLLKKFPWEVGEHPKGKELPHQPHGKEDKEEGKERMERVKGPLIFCQNCSDYA
jgi:hypothetical protein